uniref:Uncharacterized protein n=1 Tax=Anas platyrhynchos platyrhynchos TaxID=8840 RepID=A0A493SSG7_ANAPP
GFTTGIPATKGLLSWGATTAPIPPQQSPTHRGDHPSLLLTTQPSSCPPKLALDPQPEVLRWHRGAGEEVTTQDHAPPAPLTRCHQLGLVFLIPHLLLLHVAAGEEKPHHPVEELVGELDGERDHVHLEGRERHTR